MDIASIVGVTSGVLLLCLAMTQATETPQIFIDVNSVIIVIGGTIAASLIASPLRRLKKIGAVTRNVFKEDQRSPVALINNLVRYAEIARKDGILALEGTTGDIDDDFLIKGIQLAVDGTDPDLINETLRTELEYISDRHSQGRKTYENAGKYAPAFGMIGTLIGLVAMLAGLDDPSAIGKGMAVALLTTMYGAILANLIFLPIADKLKDRDGQEELMKEIVIRGVMSIQSGDNPRIVAQKLRIFLPPGVRAVDEEAA